MKSIRFTIPCLMVLVCLCPGLSVQAQQPEPDRPYIDILSVDPLSGHITITWGMPVLDDPSPLKPDKFVLYWRVETPGGTTHHAFDTVSKNIREYTFDYVAMVAKYPNMPDPRRTSVPFTVAAIKDTIDETSSPKEISSMRAIPHYNVQVNSKYDSCRAEIRLNWHRYRIWQTNTEPKKPLIGYHVMRIPEGGGIFDAELIEVLSASDTFHVEPKIKENDKYTFFIKAIRSDLAEATSYHTFRETKMPIPPDTVIAVSTGYNSEGLAEISFKIDPNAGTYTYEFLGSSDYNFSFYSLGPSINIHNDTVLTDIQTREKTFYYKLNAWHICKNKYTAYSNMATALKLTVKQEGLVNLLFWNPYVDWGGKAQYDIYRKIGDNPEEVIGTVDDAATTETTIQVLQFMDDLSDMNDCINGVIYYWIIAKPVSPNFSNQQEQAISNKPWVIPESKIWMPQAFMPDFNTPDSSDPNAKYKPFFCPLPENFIFHVYDRTGAKVFETSDLEAGSDGQLKHGWDGRFMNGKPASEGVYTYYIRFRTAMGRLVEKRGTFSLILP